MMISRRTFTIIVATLLSVPSLASAVRAGEALALVEGYMAAWNAHDANAAAAFLADNATYLDASVGTPVVGRKEAMHKVIEVFLNAAPDAKWERTGRIVESGKDISFEWTFSGTNTGDWADGTKATGKPFAFSGVTMISTDGNKITYQGDYYDALGFFKQLGLM
jgi:steroid delta-isomerase-like uncharacterized protein